ncbi:MAG: zinc-binding alcohol dehydrogenase [Pseudomonadota bacterium]
MPTATALWITAPETASLRPAEVVACAGDVVVRTAFSAISRGTERLVFQGRVPRSEHQRMRAPFQDGSFPFPVKYGYAAVGAVDAGPKEWLGRTVFALYPHQTLFALPPTALIPVPQDVPPERAVLAANMETALNIVWDGGVAPGDRVAVVGAGVVGALAGWLAARIPGTEVTLYDIAPERAALADRLGCHFALAALDGTTGAGATGDADCVIHTSASAAGLALSLSLAGAEAAVVEASWYGDRAVPAPLGAAFHAGRLRLISSQVGQLPAMRRPRWTHRRRLTTAMALLRARELDVLFSGETPLTGLATAYRSILNSPMTLCHRVRHDPS